MKSKTTAFLGLGSNLQDPVAQLARAIESLKTHAAIEMAACSSIYGSAPVGDAYQGQPDYANAVAKIETDLSARALLETLLSIEREFGRRRDIPNASRTLDLDLLLYGDLELDEPGLQVPHPRMHQRAFVLEPLFEIDPTAQIPGKGAVAALKETCRDQSLTLLETA